jgi:glyoxylate reductase
MYVFPFETGMGSSTAVSTPHRQLPADVGQKETRHKISTYELGKTKKGVIIVNTARGAVIDEEALVSALEEGHIAGVGLDVYEHEPQIHPGLLTNPRVMLLPHLGTWTVEVRT